MMPHHNNDSLVSRGRAWTCQNIKISSSQSPARGKSWSQDHRVQCWLKDATYLQLHTCNFLSSEPSWFASPVLSLAKWTIWHSMALFGLRKFSITNQYAIVHTWGVLVMLVVSQAHFAWLAQDYLGLVTRTIWWEESSRKHLLNQLYYLDQLENSIIDNVSIMSESWLFPCILLKSSDIWPQLWQERPSDPKTHIVYIWPLFIKRGFLVVELCETWNMSLLRGDGWGDH